MTALPPAVVTGSAGAATTPGVDSAAPTEPPAGRVQRRTRGSWPIGTLVTGGFLVLVALAVAAPGLLAPYPPDLPAPGEAFGAPSPAHLLGTDQSGRDLLSRLIFGARQSVLVGLAATLIGVGGGGLLGLLAAVGGRWADAVISRLVEVLFAFPALLLALLFVTILGTGIVPAAIAVGIGSAPGYARMVRGTALQVSRSSYVEAARVLGRPTWLVVLRTVVPNVIRPLFVLGTLGIGQAVVWASALSFLGLGAQPPAAEWGTMLADGRSYVHLAWWIAVFPGLAITLTAVSTTVLGRTLQRRLDGRAAS